MLIIKNKYFFTIHQLELMVVMTTSEDACLNKTIQEFLANILPFIWLIHLTEKVTGGI